MSCWVLLLPNEILDNIVNKFCDASDRICLRATCKELNALIPQIMVSEKHVVLWLAFQHFGENKTRYLNKELGYTIYTLFDPLFHKILREDNAVMLKQLIDFNTCGAVISNFNTIMLESRNIEIPNVLTFMLPYMKSSITCRQLSFIWIVVHHPYFIETMLKNDIVCRNHFENFVDTFMVHFTFEMESFRSIITIMIENKFDTRSLLMYLLRRGKWMDYFKELAQRLQYCPRLCCERLWRIDSEFHTSIYHFCECQQLKKKRNYKNLHHF
jgi:hypothetical protein